MSKDSRSERERLKEEYKAHYRKVRKTKERLLRAKKTQNITNALKEMDKSQMLESFDHFLDSVKHRIASVEARLDVAMNSLDPADSSPATSDEDELDEQMDRVRAKETLKQMKMEMGLLYEEIEQQAGSIRVEKTIGAAGNQSSDADKTKDQS
ncbi:MAG TPA: hypothetical protein VK112_02495 [Fodinibius sp.]|nr:hypothetical protein [Fodinibius sp.]